MAYADPALYAVLLAGVCDGGREVAHVRGVLDVALRVGRVAGACWVVWVVGEAVVDADDACEARGVR